MGNTNQQVMKYRSLSDVRHRKELVLEQIKTQNKEMTLLYKELLNKRKHKKSGKKSTVSTVVKTSMGILDALLFGWKLYRKYKK